MFNPLEIKNRPSWMREFAQAPSVTVFDDRIRVYFSCRPLADEKGQYVSYSGFADFDRNNLLDRISVCSEPILQLGSLGAFDEFGTYPVSVILHKEHMLAYYGGWTRCESVPFNVAIGLAHSHDGGNTFSKLGTGPVLSYSLDEPFVIGGPKIRRFNDRWYLWYIAGSRWVIDRGRPEPVYKIRMASSMDGVNWIKQKRDLIESRLEENEAQASPDVFFQDGKYHMFFCYRYSTGYRGKQRGYRIGYAVSHDLLNWNRDDAIAGLDVSESGWDSEMVSYPHVFELDGDLYMLYLGNEVGRHGFGLAVAE
jgi:predicted GH43/DUF377 family glycosyl hydrolase